MRAQSSVRVHSLPTVFETRSQNKVESLAEPVYRKSRNHPGRLRVRDGMSAGVSEALRTSYAVNAKYTQLHR